MTMRQHNRGFGGPPPLPKPYAFVPFPEDRSELKFPPGHDCYGPGLLTGTIEGVISALSPVHVASGNIELTGSQPSLVKAHFRCGDAPTIPASSLKGAVRSIVEAIAKPPACVRVTHARFDALPPNARTCRDKAKLCIACRLFGAMGYQGRVQFRDAAMTEGGMEVATIPSLFAPRTRDRLYYAGREVKGRKFYMHGLGDGRLASGNVPIEVCRESSRFRLHVDFVNLGRDELGLLLVALGQGEPPLVPKLGGGKPACCGSVRIEVSSVVTRGAAAVEFEAPCEAYDFRPLVAESRLVDPTLYGQLSDVLRFPGDERCRDRNY